MPDTAPLSARTRQAYGQLADWIAERRQRSGLRVLGINGAQGSGKSTLAAWLVEQLAAQHGLAAIAVSLDDFYLSRAQRAQLARNTHTLLATRGVPGTHDARRGRLCLRQLRNLKPGEVCRLPQFSKASDDSLGPEQDRIMAAQPDLILLEGWCVGTPPQREAELAAPVNALERDADPQGIWRRYVNQQLAGPYADWYAELDALVYLQVPGWAQVRQWRAQQEQETAAGHGGRSALMDPDRLERFLQHYQRLTEQALKTLPRQADVLLRLNPAHAVDEAHYA